MKKHQMAVCLFLVLTIAAALSACGGPKVPIDYADAEAFESALRSGEDPEGKVVRFVVTEVHPDALIGYNVSAGDRLCFVPQERPSLKEGDTVTARVTKATGLFGSWIILYEEVSNAVIVDTTVSSASSQPSEEAAQDDSDTAAPSEQSSPADVEDETPSILPLELVDHGFAPSSSLGGTEYINYCGMIYNPNEDLAAIFPKLVITVKNKDGSILTTDHQTGSIVMPGDTITLCGMFSLLSDDITEDTVIYYDVEWSDLTTGTLHYSGARTTDFEISNISERSGDLNDSITGEITNRYSEDVDQVCLTLLLRKDGEIVFIDNTYVDNLKAGVPKAFKFERYRGWPEHDTIDISAMVW